MSEETGKPARLWASNIMGLSNPNATFLACAACILPHVGPRDSIIGHMRSHRQSGGCVHTGNQVYAITQTKPDEVCYPQPAFFRSTPSGPASSASRLLSRPPLHPTITSRSKNSASVGHDNSAVSAIPILGPISVQKLGGFSYLDHFTLATPDPILFQRDPPTPRGLLTTF